MYRTRVLIAGICLLLLTVVVALWRERQRRSALGAGPASAGGQVERCLLCHASAVEDPRGAHAAAALGCSPCHLGNRLAFDQARAHAGLEREPGALATVDRTCGRAGCHARETARVATSLMARAAGIIAVDRWVFGEIPAPDGDESMAELLLQKGPRSAAQDHLSKLCAGCHLHSRRDNRDDAIAEPAGSGCAACHYRRGPAGAAQPGGAAGHGAIDSLVADGACLGCHSRSGRVSLAYQGLAEVQAEQLAGCASPARLHDGRPACRLAADVHHDAGLGCIDCHLHTDLMGDLVTHRHKEDQVEITCQSCHGPSAGAEPSWAAADAITVDLARLRGRAGAADDRVRTGRRGTVIYSLHLGAGPTEPPVLMVGKLSGRSQPVPQTPVADPDHRLAGHERLSCAACHSAWAPTCQSCHVRFEPAREQWDFGRRRPVLGAWVEQAEGFGWAAPSLGVRADGQVVPVVPGMILRLTKQPGEPAVDRRLFAPLEPHTTARAGRSCASCHRSPQALGLGTGQLSFEPAGPRFRPARPAATEPALAHDGWTTLLPPKPAPGTRTGLRSLSAAEQRRVLRVGLCLPCHDRSSAAIYRDFAASLQLWRSAASACQLPVVAW